MIKHAFGWTLLLSVVIFPSINPVHADANDTELDQIVSLYTPHSHFKSFRMGYTHSATDFPTPPEEYSLESYIMNIKDQKSTSTCSSFAVTQAVEIRKNIDMHYSLSPFAKEWQITKTLQHHYEELSPIFLYTTSRWNNGTLHTPDNGMSLKENLLTLKKYGIGREKKNPFQNTLKQLQTKPSARMLKDARNQIDIDTLAIRRVHKDWNTIQTALWTKMPLMLAIDTYTSMDSDEVRENGIIPMPDIDQEIKGDSHALTPIGYGFPTQEDSEPYLKVVNSWGPHHGASGTIFNGKKTKGFLWLPQEYVLDKSLSYQIFGLETVSELKTY